MKIILAALGLFLSLQMYGQRTVTYSYDSAGNRAARTVTTVASATAGSAEETGKLPISPSLHLYNANTGSSLASLGMETAGTVSVFPRTVMENLNLSILPETSVRFKVRELPLLFTERKEEQTAQD